MQSQCEVLRDRASAYEFGGWEWGHHSAHDRAAGTFLWPVHQSSKSWVVCAAALGAPGRGILAGAPVWGEGLRKRTSKSSMITSVLPNHTEQLKIPKGTRQHDFLTDKAGRERA